MIKIYTENKLNLVKNEEWNKGYKEAKKVLEEKLNTRIQEYKDAYNLLDDNYQTVMLEKELNDKANEKEINDLKTQINIFKEKEKELKEEQKQCISYISNEEEYKKQIKNLKTSISLYKTNKTKRDKSILDLFKNLKEKYNIEVEKLKDGSFDIKKIIKKKNPGHLYDGPKKETDKYFINGTKLKTSKEHEANNGQTSKQSVIQRLNNIHRNDDAYEEITTTFETKDDITKETISPTSIKIDSIPKKQDIPESKRIVVDEMHSLNQSDMYKKIGKKKKGFNKNK